MTRDKERIVEENAASERRGAHLESVERVSRARPEHVSALAHPHPNFARGHSDAREAVLPDLDQKARADRLDLGLWRLHAQGPAVAAAKVDSHKPAAHHDLDLPACRVSARGPVPWSSCHESHDPRHRLKASDARKLRLVRGWARDGLWTFQRRRHRDRMRSGAPDPQDHDDGDPHQGERGSCPEHGLPR